MKLEQLIVQYLYQSKKITLQDIGTFTISADVILPVENEKEALLPAGAIGFEYDPRAAQDDSLIEFIMQQTRKIRPLAASDLESYSILSKQFLNIGKPLVIEGLGTLQKNQAGVYEFTQGQLVNARLESAPSRMAEKNSDEISFRSTEKRNDGPSKKGGMLALVLLLILVAGAAIFYFFYSKKDKVAEQPVAEAIDTSATIAVKPDTSIQLSVDTSIKAAVDSVSLKPVVAPPPTGDHTFSVVVKIYQSKKSAEDALVRLAKYDKKLFIAPLDSVRYKISMPFTLPLSDTARAKDSVRIFFGTRQPSVDLQ